MADRVQADEIFEFAIRALKSGASIEVMRAELEAANRFVNDVYPDGHPGRALAGDSLGVGRLVKG